jgi:hypothetical protein
MRGREYLQNYNRPRHQIDEVLGGGMVPKSIAEDTTRWAVSGALAVASAVTALFLAVVV